jgi:hypothetical protein
MKKPSPLLKSLKKPSPLLKSLALHYPLDSQGFPVEDEETLHPLMLRCQACGGAQAWIQWVDFNSRCPDCSSDRAAILHARTQQ